MKVALYGGTFNPPHIGHFSVVQTLSPHFDKIIVMPAAVPPHKPVPPDSPSDKQRLEMARLTFGVFGNVQVSDMEIKRGGVSHTVDTIKQLGNVTLIIGTDMLKSFEQWYQFEEIIRLAEIAVLRRDGEDAEENAQKLRALYGARVRVLEHKPIDISSTRIRGHFKGREKVLALIGPQRMEHSLATECEAVRLAEHWGEDAELAGWTGLLHDCTKAWKAEKHLQFCKECNIILDSEFIRNEKLLHGVTAAAIAKRDFGLSDEAAEAIRWHTTGRPGMTAFEKIIYVADKIEPSRNYQGVDWYRDFAYENLNLAMLEILNRNIIKLVGESKYVHEMTLDARNYYLRKFVKNGEAVPMK